MTLKNFRTSDFKKDESTVKVAASTRDRFAAPEPTTQPVVAPDANPEDVPAGSIPEILTWVGEDVERAQKALGVELADAKPRKGLVSQLKGLVESADDDLNDEDSSDEEE